MVYRLYHYTVERRLDFKNSYVPVYRKIPLNRLNRASYRYKTENLSEADIQLNILIIFFDYVCRFFFYLLGVLKLIKVCLMNCQKNIISCNYWFLEQMNKSN